MERIFVKSTAQNGPALKGEGHFPPLVDQVIDGLIEFLRSPQPRPQLNAPKGLRKGLTQVEAVSPLFWSQKGAQTGPITLLY